MDCQIGLLTTSPGKLIIVEECVIEASGKSEKMEIFLVVEKEPIALYITCQPKGNFAS